MSEFGSEFETETKSETGTETEAGIEKKKVSQTNYQKSGLIHLILLLSQVHLLEFLLLESL